MDLGSWIKVQPAEIRKGLSIATPSGIYHISTNPNIKRFIPMVGTRQLPSENRTIPRVCCAATLADAIRGHAAVTGQAINRWKSGEDGKFYIYKFPFRECIRPDKSLVADVDVTKELWIVPNAPETGAFKAPIVGEFIVTSVSEEYEDGKVEHEFTILIKTSELVHVDDSHTLVGYAEMELERKSTISEPVPYNSHKVDDLKVIDANVYAEKLATIQQNVARE